MLNKDFEEHIKVSTNKILNHTENDLYGKFAVALSGGSDSLSLSIALKKNNFDILAILVNHHLRKEADDEIKKTIKILKKFNIDFIVKEWDGKYKKNLEAEARKNRYKLLIETCKENKINTLFIGHHIDDQVETFFLNLTRGSGLDGLCAMPKIMNIDNIKIVRPMLNLTKRDCKNYLQKLNISWCEDKSNKDIKYKRNKLRYLLEQIEDKDLITKRIANTVENLQEVRETLEIIVKNIMKNEKIIKFDDIKKQYKIDKNEFLNFTKYLQKTILTQCILQLSGREYKMRLYQIENLIESIKKSINFKRTLANCIIELKSNIIYIKIN